MNKDIISQFGLTNENKKLDQKTIDRVQEVFENMTRGNLISVNPVAKVSPIIPNKPKDVNIKPMHNGFLVKIGTQSFVFETYFGMLNFLETYYKDPAGTEKLSDEGKLFVK